MNTIITLLITFSIPNLLFGIVLKRIEHKIDHRDQTKKLQQILIVQGVQAAITLGEACTIALRDGKTNGETKEALKVAQKAKSELKDFLISQGINNI